MLSRSALRYSLPVLLTAAVLGALPGLAFRDRPIPESDAARMPKPLPDWPMFGGSPSRNMVNLAERNLAALWSVADNNADNIRWIADIGTRSFGSPIVAQDRVFIGTNNGNPRNAGILGPNKAVLMAFRASDGKFLWQTVHDPAMNLPQEVAPQGLLSTPSVDRDRLFYITPSCKVICADVADGKQLWHYDMQKVLGVRPCYCNASSPLVVGDLVFVTTGNGVDPNLGILLAPKAPSFIALNKNDGKLAWQSSLPGADIIEGQWSSPTYANVNGRAQVIFAGGDGVVYSFEPATGKLLWKCNCNPQRLRGQFDNYFVATPVVVGDRLYVGLGMHPENPNAKKAAHFVCLDITKEGDVSPKSHDASAAENRGSALVWSFGGLQRPPPIKGRRALFGSTMSTAAIQDGLVYIPEEMGYLHCLDAQTGVRYWEYDFKASVWGSAYCADGKVYVGTDAGEIHIFGQGMKLRHDATIDMDNTIRTTPVAAQGTLYVATTSKLYAIANNKVPLSK